MAIAFDEGDELGGQSREVGQGFMDHHRLGRRRARGGVAGRAFGGDAFALDEQDGLIGFAGVPGAIAFEEHAGRSGGRQGINHLLETTLQPPSDHCHYFLYRLKTSLRWGKISQVVPLRPEFIRPQDGQVKQDCEINAAKRWLAAHAAHYSTGNDTLLGDDLYAHQPFCRQVLLHGFHFLFTCKPASHAHLSGWVAGLEPGRPLPSLKLRVKGQGRRWEHHQYRWANGVPLTDRDDALNVNWCELTVTDGEGRLLYHNSCITDWEISADNVSGLVAAGRARWKIENEHNNVLKTRGYHLEHNFGHGQKHLSSVLLSLNLLAFGLHTLWEVADTSYQLVRAAVGARRKFFQHLEALTAYWFLASWEGLMDFMMRGQEVGPYAIHKS